MVSELEVQIRQTKAFIATRPVSVSLQPHALQPDGTGGRKLTPTNGLRQAQTMRFIETSESVTRSTTVEGEQNAQRATLLALPDAQMDVNDTFEWDGKTWRVEDILFDNDYEKRASVIQYGR